MGRGLRACVGHCVRPPAAHQARSGKLLGAGPMGQKSAKILVSLFEVLDGVEYVHRRGSPTAIPPASSEPPSAPAAVVCSRPLRPAGGQLTVSGESETTFIAAQTTHDKAIPLELCFTVPKMYKMKKPASRVDDKCWYRVWSTRHKKDTCFQSKKIHCY